jgi:hypothetical protein
MNCPVVCDFEIRLQSQTGLLWRKSVAETRQEERKRGRNIPWGIGKDLVGKELIESRN